MTASQLRELIERDKKLQEGKTCIIRWTNTGRQYQAKGVISKVNAKSVVVKLSEALDGYSVGHPIRVPRLVNMKTWSPNNCVLSIEN